MRFEHVFHEVPDVDAAVAWWRELAPDAEVTFSDAGGAVIEAGGVRLALAAGGQPAVRLTWRVSLEAIERLAEHYGASIATREDGARALELEAPGVIAVDVVAYPPDEDASE